MASQRPVGIFDSGMGGLSLLHAALEILPHEDIIYFGDTARVPYGPKSLDQVQAFSLEITGYLVERGIKALVVACNTATAAAIKMLRKTWPDLPILGMEPAVKPAIAATGSQVVAVLATQATFSSPRYADLVERYGYEATILEDPCLGLVDQIEAGELEGGKTEALLRRILEPMLEKGADTIVLGCTHYPLVRPLIEQITGPGVHIIDPAPAVAAHLKTRLNKNRLLNSPSHTPVYDFLVSGPSAVMQSAVRNYLDLPHQVKQVVL